MSNYAERILDVINRMSKIQNQEPSTKVWLQVLGIDEAESQLADFRIARRLEMLQWQLGRLRATLEARGKSMAPFDTTLRRLESAFSVRNLGVGWNNVLENIKPPEVRASLSSAAALLPDDEWPEQEDIARLQDEVEQLAQRIESANLPDELTSFLREQIELLRQAIDEFPWRGPQAFHEASDRAAQAWAVAPRIVHEMAATEIVRETFGLWHIVKTYGRRVALLGAFAHGVFVDPVETLDGIQKTVNWIQSHERPTKRLPPPSDALPEESVVDFEVEAEEPAPR